MSRRILLRSTLFDRQQTLPKKQSYSRTTRVGEVVGEATAECAAICCCCPCSIAELLVLVIYKVPAGLCRRALRKKRRQRLMKKGLWPPKRSSCPCGCDEMEIKLHSLCLDDGWNDLNSKTSLESDKEVEKLEKEMWDTFLGTGFWRSPSQRLRDSSENLISNSNSNLQASATRKR